MNRKVTDVLTELRVGQNVGDSTKNGLRLSSLDINIPRANEEISQMILEAIGPMSDTAIRNNKKVEFKDTAFMQRYRNNILEKLKEKGFKI